MNDNNSNLCSLWGSLTLDPARESKLLDQDTVIALMNHAGACERCNQLLSEAHNTADIYEALALSTSGQPYDDRTARLIALRDSNNQQLEQAIIEVLLPSLPWHLRQYRNFIGEDLSPNQLYLAGDAISMMLHRIRRQHPAKPRRFVMVSELAITGTEIDESLPAETIVGEVRNVARVDSTAAVRLATWVFAAARVQSKLMLGIDSRPQGKDSLLLLLTKRGLDEDLAARWSPAGVLVGA